LIALSDVNTANNLPQIVRAPNVNRQFDWAGEIVPSTPDATERLDRELMVNSYYHSSTKYLAVAESGLRHVASHASAKGFWQFRKLAAKEYGLEVNDEVDERYHVERSTIAACKYLLWLKSIQLKNTHLWIITMKSSLRSP